MERREGRMECKFPGFVHDPDVWPGHLGQDLACEGRGASPGAPGACGILEVAALHLPFCSHGPAAWRWRSRQLGVKEGPPCSAEGQPGGTWAVPKVRQRDSLRWALSLHHPLQPAADAGCPRPCASVFCPHPGETHLFPRTGPGLPMGCPVRAVAGTVGPHIGAL